MSGEVLALVNYYARNGYYRHVQTVCNEVLKKRGSTDPTLVFWRALGMLTSYVPVTSRVPLYPSTD